jgi:hypothetical protein
MPESIPSFRPSNPGLPRYPNTPSAQPTTQGRPANLPLDVFERQTRQEWTSTPEPRWTLVSVMLVVIGLLIGAGLAYGGPLTAVGLGIGYLTVALVHLVWPDLERIWKANI